MEYVYKFISLYEIFCISGLVTSSVLLKNIYPFVISIIILLCSVPEKITKKILPIPPYLNKRPEGSKDCNVLNEGGDYTYKEGFPSGHTSKTWFLFTYSLIQYIKEKKNNKALTGLVIVTSLYAVLVPVSRLQLKCHTIHQVIGGMVYGIVWAFLFFSFEEKVLLEWNLYKQNKETIINYLDWNQ